MGTDVFRRLKIRNGPGNFQNSVICSGRKVKFFHSQLNKIKRGFIQFAECINLPGTDLSITTDIKVFIAFILNLSCSQNPFPDVFTFSPFLFLKAAQILLSALQYEYQSYLKAARKAYSYTFAFQKQKRYY